MIDRIRKFVLGGEKEREVMDLIREHVGLIIGASELLRVAVERSDSSVIGEICEIEKMGDAIRRDVMVKIYGGAFLPAVRSNFCSLIEALDEVLDEIEDIATLFLMIEIPDSVASDFTRIAEINYRMSLLLQEALDALESGELKDVLLRIKISEEEVDAIKTRVYQKMRGLSFDSYPDWHFFMKFTDKLVNVSDLMEDAADIMQIIAVSFR